MIRKKIPFEMIRYEHEEKGAVFAAQATGSALDQTIKTLVADLGGGTYVLALMPGDRQLSLKHLAQAFSVKKAGMADPQTAERVTGYLTGGISPFGTRQNLPAVMEKGLLVHEFVLINGGQRGVMLKMAPADILKALKCKISELVQE